MKRTLALATLAFALGGLLAAQEVQDIRAPEINTETPEGQLLVEAGVAEEIEEKIPPLERLVEEFPESKYRGYAYLQLQGAYIEQKQYAKAVEVGAKLLELVPDDLEVLHNINQSLLQLGSWDDLAPRLAQTLPIGEKEAASPKPADADEDEEAVWQNQVAYAEGVVQWLEWATNTATTQQTDPLKKIEWMDLLRKRYPDSPGAQNLETNYMLAYQQAGDQPKMYEWMDKAVTAGQGDETYLYMLAENAYGAQDYDASKAYAEQILERLEATGDGPREGMTPEQWAAHKAKHDAYGNFVIGRTWVTKNTKPAFRTGRTHLLKTVDFLKAEGGPRYHMLSYFLGICYVQLDIRGDNIKQALYWMGQAASTEGAFKGQAAATIKKIKAI